MIVFANTHYVNIIDHDVYGVLVCFVVICYVSRGTNL